MGANENKVLSAFQLSNSIFILNTLKARVYTVKKDSTELTENGPIRHDIKYLKKSIHMCF